MVRVGGLAYTIDPSQGDRPPHRRSDLALKPASRSIRPRNIPSRGWASVNEGTEGPPIWDVVTRHIRSKRTVAPAENSRIRVVGQ